MFAYFKGKVYRKDIDKIVLDVNNIGYEIFMPAGDIESLTVGAEAFVHTFTDIKEGYIGIFGFLNEEALSVFEKIKKVSGIGSKTALAILSHMTPSEVCLAIANEDSTLISKVPGIGAKTAARLILELKDKVLKDSIVTQTKTKTKNTTSNARNEAMLALKVLGYTALQINEAMDELDLEDLKVEEIIKKVLGTINKR